MAWVSWVRSGDKISTEMSRVETLSQSVQQVSLQVGDFQGSASQQGLQGGEEGGQEENYQERSQQSSHRTSSTTTSGHSTTSPSNLHLLGLHRLQRLHQLVGEGRLAGAVHRLKVAGGSSVGLGLLHRILPRLDVVLDGGRPHLGKIKDLDGITSLRVRVTDHRTLLGADDPPGVVIDGVEAGEVVPTGGLYNPPIKIFQLNRNVLT